MIEDIEERLLRLGLTDESLDIVDDEHIHLLVEVYEHTTLGTTHQAVTHELCFKLRARHVGWSSMARCPIACERWVFPTPLGP